jgi:hypothetical protein
MSLTFSKREIGLIYTLLRSTNDSLLENSSAESASTEGGETSFPKSARLNKLIAANLRQKLQSELAEER